VKRLLLGALLLLAVAAGGCKRTRTVSASDLPVPYPACVPAPSALVLGIIGAGLVGLYRRLKA